MTKKLKLKKVVKYDKSVREEYSAFFAGSFVSLFFTFIVWMFIVSEMTIEPYHGWFIFCIPLIILFIIYWMWKSSARKVTYEEV